MKFEFAGDAAMAITQVGEAAVSGFKRAIRLLPVAVLVTLTACGGGSGGGAAAPVTPAVTYPASGTYAIAIKPAGTSSALSSLTMGLSLIHPDDRSIEYPIELPSANVTDLATVYSGSVDVAGMKVANVQAVAVVYIAGGNIKWLPLVANGASPASRTLSGGGGLLCKLIVQGNDYAVPTNSRYMASTKGADGVCGTADDNRAEVSFDSSGRPSASVAGSFASEELGLFRDPATLKPAAWIETQGIANFSPLHNVMVMRVNGASVSRVLVQAPASALIQDNGKLTVWASSGAETTLSASITAGSGWTGIGYDATNFYAYYNSGTTNASSWKVIKVSRVTPTATVLGTGTGYIALDGMGSDNLYFTISTVSGYGLYKLAKLVPGALAVVEPASSSSLPAMLASSQGVHAIFRISLAGNTPTGYSLSMLEESTGAMLYAAGGGFPMGLADPSAINLNNSESRSRFVFATNATPAKGLSGTSVVTYDAATRTVVSLGTLPGSSDFGTNTVVSTMVPSPSGLMMGGYVSALSGSTIQSSTLKLFTVNLGSANSLQFTTSVK